MKCIAAKPFVRASVAYRKGDEVEIPDDRVQRMVDHELIVAPEGFKSGNESATTTTKGKGKRGKGKAPAQSAASTTPESLASEASSAPPSEVDANDAAANDDSDDTPNIDAQTI